MKHVQFFTDFLRDEVNLNQSRLDRLNTSVRAVKEFLSDNLDSYRKVERQGSYALRTIIKPVKDGQEYDADILLYLKYNGTKEPKDYIDSLYDCLRENKIYAQKAHRKTRCVVLNYAGDFHLDIVPCVTREDEKQYICNKKINEFEQTDGTGYRDWFNDKNGITQGNLKRVTRLLKYLRDHKGNFTAKSILLTTLVGNTVSGEFDGDNFKSLPDALKTVSNRINDFLQRNPAVPRIANPVLPEEDFTRHWHQTKYSHFRKLFNVYNDKVNEAIDAKEHDDSVEEWRQLFGENFGKKRAEVDNFIGRQRVAAAAVPVVVTPKKPYAQ